MSYIAPGYYEPGYIEPDIDEILAALEEQDGTTDGAPGELADTATAAEVQASTTAQTGAVVDSEAPFEAMLSSVSLTSQSQEFGFPADEQNRSIGAAPGIAEAGNAADAQASSTNQAAQQAEAASAAEAVGGVTAVGGVEVLDSVTTSELQNAGATAVRGQVDTLDSADAVGVTLGVTRAVTETGVATDNVSGLVVMGVATVEALAALDAMGAVVGSIRGDIEDLVVLTEEQFRSVLMARGVLEMAVVSDDYNSTPIVEPTTILEHTDARELASVLLYPRPPAAGSPLTRRFIVYYK